MIFVLELLNTCSPWVPGPFISSTLFLLEMSHDSWTHCAVLLQLSYTLHQYIRASYLTGMERWKSRLQHESWQSYIRPWSSCFLTLPGPTAPLVTETVFTSAMPNSGWGLVWAQNESENEVAFYCRSKWNGFIFQEIIVIQAKHAFPWIDSYIEGCISKHSNVFFAMMVALFKLTLKLHFCLRPAWTIFQRKMCPAAPRRTELPFSSLLCALRCS